LALLSNFILAIIAGTEIHERYNQKVWK
jgi:hypothetical protein